MVNLTFKVNNNDYSSMVERDSYETSLIPVYGQSIKTMDGVTHTALLRLKGELRVSLNPQTAADTASLCTDLLSVPCEVVYHDLQKNQDVTALMVLDDVSAKHLSRCLYKGLAWNSIDSITLKEL